MTIYNVLIQILGWLGAFIILAVALVIYFGRKWIEGWLDNRFKKSVQYYEFRINEQFSRIEKIHEKEIEVLPKAWHLLQKASGRLGALTAVVIESPNIWQMSEEELGEFLSISGFKKSQIKKILESDIGNRQDVYREVKTWHNLNQANDIAVKFNNFIFDNSIFLTAPLSEKFEEADRLLMRTLRTRSMDVQYRKYSYDQYVEANGRLKELSNVIKEMVRKRLHHED